MNTRLRTTLLPITVTAFAALNLWAMAFAFADGSSENAENQESLNPSESQQPGTAPLLTTVAETGYLELEQGFVGDKLGAEIEQITVDETKQFQEVNIRIPVENPKNVDQVQVIGPAGKTIPQFKPAKISRDYEENNVGVKLFLSKSKSWVFKVKLVDNSQLD